MNKYNETYALSGNAVHILATSLAGIKGRVAGALREIRYIRPDQLPERELVTYSYNKLPLIWPATCTITFSGKEPQSYKR